MPPVSTKLAKLVAKFATGGNFAAGVVDTEANLTPVLLIPVVHLDLQISLLISKKFETVLMGYSGAGGKLIHEEKKQKIS